MTAAVSPTPGAASRPSPRLVSSFLHAGHIAVAEAPAAIRTILGSCVAVCLWDPVRRRGGMNHFLLPHFAAGAAPSPRFGNVAVDVLVEALLQGGSRKRDLMAKLFGGAGLIGTSAGGGHLGFRNVQAARNALVSHGLFIYSEDVLGTRGRRVVFDTGDGSVLVSEV